MFLSELRELMTCTRCGQCKHFRGSWKRACPSGTKYQSEMYYSSGRAWIAEGLADGKLKLDKNIAECIYSCALCRACAEMCPLLYKDANMDVMLALREECVEKGNVLPQQVKEFLENVVKFGNPYGLSTKKRDEWIEGLDVETYRDGDEFLFYVGCIGCYDPTGQESARALAQVFSKANLSFGILGKKETCDGNEVKNLGEIGLFEDLMAKQIESLKNLGVKKIVTLSPHSFNAFKNDYTKNGLDVPVYHYTQLLRDTIKDGKLDLSKGFNAYVTYHDPCYLGRWNTEYEAPREILASIPGVELIEMERNKDTSWCCGGGGGNFFTGFLSGEDSPASQRVQEAIESGAEILAVACPICNTMLTDAVRDGGWEGRLRVMDISQIVLEACK